MKTHLLKTFELSDAKGANCLFLLQGLGDSKPTELMDRMLALVGEHKLGFLLRHLFLRQLLAQVRAVLANTAITDCRALAEEADRFFLAGQQHGTTSSGFSKYAVVVPDFDLAAAAPAAFLGQDITELTALSSVATSPAPEAGYVFLLCQPWALG